MSPPRALEPADRQTPIDVKRRLRGRWAALGLDVYHRQDRTSAEIRAAHLTAIVRLTPTMMGANLLNLVLIVWTFWPQVPRGLWLWAALLTTVVALALGTWSRTRGATPATASTRAIRRAAFQALILGTLWGLLPALWFPGATAPQQLLLACMTCGMIGAGAFALSTVPHASVAYALPVVGGALVAIGRADLTLRIEISLLLLWYASAVLMWALDASRKATSLLTSERSAARQQQLVSVLLQDFESHASEALWETSAQGRLVRVSPRLAQLLGTSVDQLMDAPLMALLKARDAEAAAALSTAFDQGRPFNGLRLSVSEGEGRRWWTLRAKPLIDDDGRPLGWRGVLADVTTEMQAQQRLHTLAHSDSLTGLANRITLHETLAAALRDGRHGALMVLDLDHFKPINDSFGHSTGDAVLAAVAQRLRDCVRPGDLVARLGGDEFAVLAFSACGADDARALAARLVQRLAEPVALEGRQLRIGTSVGVTTWDESHGGVDELLVHADLALYEAKGNGRGRHVFYDPDIGERNRRRANIEHELRLALEANQLEVHYQPKADLQAWRVVGVEALLRWKHPTLGRISPAEFVPIAERCGLIHALGDWVLQQACQTAQQALQGLEVAVNVSPAQLREGDFAQRVQNILLRTRLNPSRLELEITESVFLEDVNSALSQLATLRELGVRIALDDFGTGYSSLAYLRRFPFDTLKIDRAFVNELMLRDDAKAIVRMMSQLASTMGMRTVAEGVETPEQLEQVRRNGCEAVQGYLIARPLPLRELLARLHDWHLTPAPTLAMH